MSVMRRLFGAYISQLRKLHWWQWTIAGIIVLVLGQQFIPTGIVSYSAKIDGTDVGGVNIELLNSKLTEKTESAQLALGSQTVTFKLNDAGMKADQSVVRTVPFVTQKEKFIPLLPFVQMVRPASVSVPITRDDAKLNEFAAKLSHDYFKVPTDASAAVKDGTLVITDDKPGERFETERVVTALNGFRLNGSTPKVQAVTVNAERKTADFEALKSSFTSATKEAPKLSIDGQAIQISLDEYKKWLTVSKNEDGAWHVTVDGQAIDSAVKTWAKKVDVAPGVTDVSYVDGVEVSRKVGPSGKALSKDTVMAKLNEWIAEPKPDIVAIKTGDVAPRIRAISSYSNSSAGLTAKISDWVKSHNGTYSVAVRKLTGSSITGSYNSATNTVAASTYKLFVAYAAYHLSEANQLNLGDAVYGGQSIEQCIQKSIVYSDNECAMAIGKKIGWAKIDEMVAAAGFLNVRLNNYTSTGALSGDKKVSPGQLAELLQRLENGTLINGTNRGKLLGYMKAQVYRSGVPAGVSGSTVADKVGFLDGYLHDAAIVYAPSGTYVVVIMTYGSSWSTIANLSQTIHEFLKQ